MTEVFRNTISPLYPGRHVSPGFTRPSSCVPTCNPPTGNAFLVPRKPPQQYVPKRLSRRGWSIPTTRRSRRRKKTTKTSCANKIRQPKFERRPKDGSIPPTHCPISSVLSPIPFIILAHLFSLPSSGNSDPGSHSRLFFPLPTTVRVLHFYRDSISALFPLVDSRPSVPAHSRRSLRLSRY